jgi:hypothetical protein
VNIDRETLMPMYYFHLHDTDLIRDVDGTDLPDLHAARNHATGVARELTFRSTGMLHQSWSDWSLKVHDDKDNELFSMPLSDFEHRAKKA